MGILPTLSRAVPCLGAWGCHVWSWLGEFSRVVLSCFTTSRLAAFTEVSVITPADSPRRLHGHFLEFRSSSAADAVASCVKLLVAPLSAHAARAFRHLHSTHAMSAFNTYPDVCTDHIPERLHSTHPLISAFSIYPDVCTDHIPERLHSTHTLISAFNTYPNVCIDYIPDVCIQHIP